MLRRFVLALLVLASPISSGCDSSTPAETAWLSCSFLPTEDEAREEIAHCVRRGADGRLVVGPDALQVLSTRGDERASVRVGGELHYLNAAGVAVPVLPFDNGADDFVEGLARTVQGGKVGFIDERLNVVIEPVWDFAFPFEKGSAIVCEDCTFRPVGDEHTEVVGGRWGSIDRQGRILVPVTQSREGLRVSLPR